jgi:DNA-binding transcriptional MerR regulator
MSDEEARCALEASEKRYYRIGEVSKLTGVKAHVLRYWETEFRWMAPPKSRSKQRLYRKRDIEFVWLLKKLLWEERYTIAGARQRIQELGVDGALALIGVSSEGEGEGAATEEGAPATLDAAESIVLSDGGGLRAALDEMHAELIGLRGLLQDGLVSEEGA